LNIPATFHCKKVGGINPFFCQDRLNFQKGDCMKLKRAADVILAVVIALVLLPLILIVAGIVWCETRRFPFFIQERALMLERKHFMMLKFRTIRTNAVAVREHRSVDIFKKSFYAAHVPPICAWLRCTGLDELPQLWNILKGEMSFVGPRPLSLDDLAAMKQETPELYRSRAQLQCEPGLTGTWQLFGDREGGMENLVSLDLEYDRSRSFMKDVSLLMKTLPLVLFAYHSDAIISSRSRMNFLSAVKKIKPFVLKGEV
jgi:exopolysaccharide production protein ExoY